MKSQKVGLRNDDSHTSSLEHFVIGFNVTDEQNNPPIASKNGALESANITLDKNKSCNSLCQTINWDIAANKNLEENVYKDINSLSNTHNSRRKNNQFRSQGRSVRKAKYNSIGASQIVAKRAMLPQLNQNFERLTSKIAVPWSFKPENAKW